jgi:hypothetical protein
MYSSNKPFDSNIYRRWSAQTASHNTVVVDRTAQKATMGQLDFFDNQGPVKVLDASAGEAYPGMEYRRVLMLTDGYLFDVFRVVGPAEHTFDWGLHAIGTLNIELPMGEPAAQWSDEPVYSLVRNVAMSQTDKTWSASWNLLTDPHWQAYKHRPEAQWTDKPGEGRFLRVTMLGGADTEVRKGRVPRYQRKWTQFEASEDQVDWHEQVFATRKGQSTVFIAAYETYRGKPRIQDIRQLPVTDSAGRAVRDTDGVAASIRCGDATDVIAVTFSPGEMTVDGITFEAAKMVVRRLDGQIEWIYLAEPKSLTVDGQRRTFNGEPSVTVRPSQDK